MVFKDDSVVLRQQQLNDWLQQVLPEASFSLTPASADASFRSYFRVHTATQTLIAMDAPPPQEDCAPFVHAAKVFGDAGLNVPRVLAQNLEQGFLLLTDLGDTTFLAALAPATANDLYRDARQALVKMQLASREGVFPLYDEALLNREMQLFPDWYVAKHSKVDLT
ncbi:MAG: aminoglycoside phosphotransferase family protein, partial [Methylophilaceae bacterium]